MKTNLLVLLGAAVIVTVFLVIPNLPMGIETPRYTPPQEPPAPEFHDAISAHLDNYTYGSGDDTTLKITINLTQDINDALIEISGIKNKYGSNTIWKLLEQDLQIGENQIEYDFEAPSCYGCAGVAPGVYEMHASLSYANGTHIMNATSEFELVE